MSRALRKVATLCLGSRADANTWEAGCKALGFTVVESIRTSNPSVADMAKVFGSGADWIFFGGHFAGSQLFNHDHTASARFHDAVVDLRSGTASSSVAQGTTFSLHSTALVVLWGGCSVASSTTTVRTMRRLFGQHTLLGFDGSTGWRIVDALLGNGFIKRRHFFDNLNRTGWNEAGEDVVMAWMEAAKAGYAKGSMEGLFRAFDWNGQEYKLSGGAIVKGRSVG